MHIFKVFKLALFLFLSLSLLGCTLSQPSMLPLAQPVVTTTPVQYIHVGESIRVVVASDYLFKPNSANLRPEQKTVLSQIVRFMNQNEVTDVTVAAYLDSHVDPQFGQALSTRQAQVVANQLWRDGLDARFMQAVGYNQRNPIAWNGDSKGRSTNRRVEISFRYYPNNKIKN